jgi:membrane-bound ClpP family serine protease
MAWKDLIVLCLIIAGVILFLYGANYYDATVGWAGFFLFVGGLVAEVALRAYEMIAGRRADQKP